MSVPVDERGPPFEVDAEHPFRRGVQDQLILSDHAGELVRLALERLTLAEQLDEDRHFRPEDLRVERLEDVVDRAELVAAEDVRLAAREGGQEDDRRVFGAVALTDQRRGLEPVEIRHLHVEQDYGEVQVQELAQRRRARLRGDEVRLHVPEDRLEGKEVVRLVIDQQNVDAINH
jgi:hypothetical protein